MTNGRTDGLDSKNSDLDCLYFFHQWFLKCSQINLKSYLSLTVAATKEQIVQVGSLEIFPQYIECLFINTGWLFWLMLYYVLLLQAWSSLVLIRNLSDINANLVFAHSNFPNSCSPTIINFENFSLKKTLLLNRLRLLIATIS